MYEFMIIVFLLLNYLIGSIPNGLIIGKIVKKVDIRKTGSGSIGATNTTRVLGKKWGIVVLLLDILKSAGFLIILRVLSDYYMIEFFKNISYIKVNNYDIPIYSIYGLFAVYGHCYSCFLKFNGGKAIATAIGVITATSSAIIFISAFLFISIFLITRYVSLASLIAALGTLIFTIIFFTLFKYNGLIKLGYHENGFLGARDSFYKYIYHIMVIVMVVVTIFIKHIPNIKRLKNGTENIMRKRRK